MATEYVNVHAAKTNLSRLIERVEAGEDVVIARAGRPVVRLVPYVDVPRRRWFGALAGEIRMLPGFDAADAEIEQDFDARLDRPVE